MKTKFNFITRFKPSLNCSILSKSLLYRVLKNPKNWVSIETDKSTDCELDTRTFLGHNVRSCGIGLRILNVILYAQIVDAVNCEWCHQRDEGQAAIEAQYWH